MSPADRLPDNYTVVMRMILISMTFCIAMPATADIRAGSGASRYIEVYPVTQHYYDTRPGDSLSEIAASLLPNNPGMQRRLMQDIVRLNPQAFMNNNPNRLLAGKRLWLPSALHRPDSKVDTRHYSVESFSWGNVKRPR